MGAALDLETGVEEQLTALARLIVDSRLAEFCGVALVGDDGRLRVAGLAGPDAETEDGPRRAWTRTAAWRRPRWRPGGRCSPRSCPSDHPAAVDPGGGPPVGVRSAMAVPMIVRGRVLAVLGMGRRGDAPPFHDDDRGLAEEMAARAALAVDNAMLLADERAAARRLALLQRATAELSAATTPVEVAVVAAEHIRQLTGPESRVAVYEVDASHRALAALTISGGTEESHRLWAGAPAVGAGHRRHGRRRAPCRVDRGRRAAAPARAGAAARAGRVDQGLRPGRPTSRCR